MRSDLRHGLSFYETVRRRENLVEFGFLLRLLLIPVEPGTFALAHETGTPMGAEPIRLEARHRSARMKGANASAASARAIEMGRAGKLAFGAIIGGMALTLALMAALDPPATHASAPPPISGADGHSVPFGTLRRCRSVTAADPECEAAWEAKRRHFFGQEKDEK